MSAAAEEDYVFSDPIAFKHLTQEEGTSIVEENVIIEGYQVYIVEQWACSRVHPVFVVTTFTGDVSNKLTVSVLRISASSESARVKHYFDTLAEYHARPKDTVKGKIFVTNLSSFPSALNLVHVPDGSVDAHREEFIVNENLRRMGCAGRTALALDPPSDATQDKFHGLYHTSDKVPITLAVIDLVKMVQSCLYLFGILSNEYIDGLLCDVTERSLIEWWNLYGTEFYDVEPTDGILGPTTVAGILGMTLGIRYRLLSLRIEAPKDMMDVEHFKEAILHFQKMAKLDRTRTLDRNTLDKLYLLTVRSAQGDRRLPGSRTLRTTVHDLSNRTMVNAADVETCDIDLFARNLHGERLRYMWQGKGRRPSAGSVGAVAPSQSFQDLKEASMSKRAKVLKGVKSGAIGVSKMVRRGPESVLERVQTKKREREDISMDVEVASIEPARVTETPRTSSSQEETQELPPLIVHEIERPKSVNEEREHHDAWYHRRLSYSVAQDAVETWHCIAGLEDSMDYHEVDVVAKWAEEQLDLVEMMDDFDDMSRIASNQQSNKSTFNSMKDEAKQLVERVEKVQGGTVDIYDTTNKLRYAYSSADGLKEKMQSVEAVMDGLVSRMDRLRNRIEAVEKMPKTESKGWWIIGVIVALLALVYLTHTPRPAL